VCVRGFSKISGKVILNFKFGSEVTVGDFFFLPIDTAGARGSVSMC